MNFGARTAVATNTTAPPIQLTPPNEPAGTVESFEGGVLKIKLHDGTVVSGRVTEETELRCQSATPPSEPGKDEDDNQENQEGQEGQQGDEQHGSSSGQFGSQHGDFFAHKADNQGGGDDQDDEHGGQTTETCANNVLVPGAVVLEAELKLSGAGAVWEKVDVVH